MFNKWLNKLKVHFSRYQLGQRLAGKGRRDCVALTQQNDALFQHKGYEIPVSLMWMTGCGPDDFGSGGSFDVSRLEQYLGLSRSMRIVEIGCGIGRDAIPLTEILSSRGAYLGIDINKEQIDWCSENITRRHPNFRFECWDVRNELYNPEGRRRLSDYQIPELNGSVDLIILQSVFSHLPPKDVSHYLKEFSRVLRPNGRVLATCFIMTEGILSEQRPGDNFYFQSAEDGFFILSPDRPSQAVAYTREKILSLMSAAGIEEALPSLVGSWAGTTSLLWQDVLFMKPITQPNTAEGRVPGNVACHSGGLLGR